MASDHPTRSDCYCPACTGDCHGCGEKHDRIVELEAELARLRTELEAESIRRLNEGDALRAENARLRAESMRGAVEALAHSGPAGVPGVDAFTVLLVIGWLEQQQAASQGHRES